MHLYVKHINHTHIKLYVYVYKYTHYMNMYGCGIASMYSVPLVYFQLFRASHVSRVKPHILQELCPQYRCTYNLTYKMEKIVVSPHS